jgi:hypothetical protein
MHKSVIVLEQKQKNETEWNQSFEDNNNKHIADWLESVNYIIRYKTDEVRGYSKKTMRICVTER